MSDFWLSQRSLRNLQGVHPDLSAVIHRAIEKTAVDFVVIEGLRTRQRQIELVNAGASQTMNSRHLTGHAVDLAAWVGAIRWDWPLYPRIAEGVRLAARELGVKMIWGGCWDRELTGIEESCEDAAEDYVVRRKAAGRRAFLDGPHFELDRSLYA